ncbi:hypothetical protein DPMN_090180, partial [Dreissena polymorpha]
LVSVYAGPGFVVSLLCQYVHPDKSAWIRRPGWSYAGSILNKTQFLHDAAVGGEPEYLEETPPVHEDSAYVSSVTGRPSQ